MNIANQLTKLTYNGKELKYERGAKFLGMYFDHLLTWHKHINDLVTRCNKDLNIMRLVSGTTFGSDKKTLLKMYFALIRSKLDYGCQAYASAAPYLLKKLDSIQAAALRIATGAYKGTRNADLNVECNVLPLNKRRDELMLKYWARSTCHNEQLPINELTQPIPAYGYRHRYKKWRPSYAFKVQDLVKKHNLQNIQLAEKTFPTIFNLRSIIPRFGLTGEISKKTTENNVCKAKAEHYINKRYNLSLKIFTDGSKDTCKGQTGCAFAIPALNYNQMFKLNKNLTVYSSELIAILKALEWINCNKPENVVILTLYFARS